MAFSLFSRTSELSPRRRLFARGLELIGVGIAALAIAGTIALPFLRRDPNIPRWMFTPFYTYVVVAAAAAYLIGVGIIRRKRWGAYLCGIAFIWPVIPRLLSSNSNLLPIRTIVLSAVGLGVAIIIRHKLGITRDADFDDDDDDETLPMPTRNRGFGESSALANTSAPEQLMTPRELDNLPVRARKIEVEIK
ncbi:MAG: hypothetical protein ABI852_11500 [Gemmatimonadaceae bacterium]